MRESDTALEGIDADTLTSRYLHVDAAAGATLKLVLSRVDRKTMSAVVEGTELPQDEEELSQNVANNYRPFRDKMGAGFTADDAQAIWNGIQRLLIIAASLDGDDRPQSDLREPQLQGHAADPRPTSSATCFWSTPATTSRHACTTSTGRRSSASTPTIPARSASTPRCTATSPSPRASCASPTRTRCTARSRRSWRTSTRARSRNCSIGLKGFCETFAAKSNSAGARRAQAAAEFGNKQAQRLHRPTPRLRRRMRKKGQSLFLIFVTGRDRGRSPCHIWIIRRVAPRLLGPAVSRLRKTARREGSSAFSRPDDD